MKTFAKLAMPILYWGCLINAYASANIHIGSPPPRLEKPMLHPQESETVRSWTPYHQPLQQLPIRYTPLTLWSSIQSQNAVQPILSGQLYPEPALEVGENPDNIIAADLNHDGAVDLVDANYTTGDISVLLGDGNGAFRSEKRYSALPLVSSPVAADFNGDGIIDIIVADYISNDGISVFLGNGDGTFQKAVNISVGFAIKRMLTADVNDDGIPDLVVTDGTNIIILIGNGDGSFHISKTYTANNGQIGTCDINGDGYPDVIAMNATDSTSSLIDVLLGNGNGTFQMPETYSPGFFPTGFTCTDFNGDGYADISVVGATTDPNTGSITGYMDMFFGQGSGVLSGPNMTQLSFPGPPADHPFEHVAGDLNGDGIPDLIVILGGDFQVFLGNGDGTFTAGESYAAISNRYTLADLNGDGNLDIAFICQDASIVPIFGNGDGTFDAQKVYSSGGSPVTLSIGDLNHDGKSDIVTANLSDSRVSVLLGETGYKFSSEKSYQVNGMAGFFWGVTIADFNGDGNPDIAVAGEDANEAGILFGNGDGTFGNSQTYQVGTQPLGIAAADLNGDGAADIVTSNCQGSSVSVLLNNGDGTFQSAKSYNAGACAGAVAIADFNGDGYPDIAVTNNGGNSVSVFLGKGDGTFLAQEVYPVGSSPWSIITADFNGDGHPDIAVTNSCTNATGPCTPSIGILMGNGDGTFRAQQTYPTYSIRSEPIGITATDTNDDGALDLVVTMVTNSTVPAYSTNTVTIFLGNGDGTFHAAQTYYAGSLPYDVKASDLDGDGWPDLIVADEVFPSNIHVMPHLHPSPILSVTHFNAISNHIYRNQLSANDPYGLPVDFSIVSPPAAGTVSIAATGKFSYTPRSGFLGLDKFMVSMSDGQSSNRGTVYITVKSPPPAPTASGFSPIVITQPNSGRETFTISGTGALTVNAVSDNTTLLPNANIAGASSCTKAGSCTLSLNPVANETGNAMVTVEVTDGYGQTGKGNFSLTVNDNAPSGGGRGSAGSSGGGGGSTPLVMLVLLGLLGISVSLRRLSGR